jgi:hypothetical protein
VRQIAAREVPFGAWAALGRRERLSESAGNQRVAALVFKRRFAWHAMVPIENTSEPDSVRNFTAAGPLAAHTHERKLLAAPCWVCNCRK